MLNPIVPGLENVAKETLASVALMTETEKYWFLGFVEGLHLSQGQMPTTDKKEERPHEL